jgi:RHS repeat-associated protein
VATSYGYDNIYQLLSATQGATTTETYAYDAVGNRTSSLGVASYTNNSSNEMTANSNASYTYDYNGNELTKVDSTGTTSYTWNFENQLTSVTLPGSGGTVQFSYDPFGRRIKKSSSAGTSIYAYDYDNLVEEANSSGAAIARYAQTLSPDDVLAQFRSSTTSYYEADGLGTVTSLSNASGTLAQTYGYDSFGKQTSASGSIANPFQYTSRELDTETGLYYFRARYLDPPVGRFLSEDPTKFYAGINFYTYAMNSPTYWIDPSGFNVTVKLFPGNQPFGHIGLGVNTNDTVGFYPNHNTGASPGNVKPDDPKTEGDPEGCIILITTPDQDKAIQNYIDNRRKHPGWWRPGRDCSNFVHDALGAGGIKADDSTFPRNVFDNLKKLPHTSCSNVTPIF